MADVSKVIFSNFNTKIMFDTADDIWQSSPVIADAFSMSENQNILESSCGYGGQIQGEFIGVASPNMTSFGDVTATLSYNLTKNQLAKISTWINSSNPELARNSSRMILCENSAESKLAYGECYFSSIALSASENSLVNCDLELWMYQNALSSGSIGGAVSMGQREPYFTDKEVIPYWATTIKITNKDKEIVPLEIVSWNVDVNQTLTKKFYCEGLATDDSPLPKDVYVGNLNIDLSITAVIPNTVFQMSDLTGDLNFDIILAGVTFLSISKVKIVSASPDLTDKGGRFITLNYRVFKLNALT